MVGVPFCGIHFFECAKTKFGSLARGSERIDFITLWYVHGENRAHITAHSSWIGYH